MNYRGRIVSYVVVAMCMAMTGLLKPVSVFADENSDGYAGPRSGLSLGGRGTYFKPKDAQGSWSGGAQLRLHFTPVIAIEGSADYRQTKFGGVETDIYPVQASLLIYLLPGMRISPYILGGAGWYYTHFRSIGGTQQRFGPHAGGGLEIFLNHWWSIDGDYRYVWNSRVNTPTTAHPLGQDFSDRGSMVTAALNFYF